MDTSFRLPISTDLDLGFLDDIQDDAEHSTASQVDSSTTSTVDQSNHDVPLAAEGPKKRISTACEACRLTKIRCQPSHVPGVCKK